MKCQRCPKPATFHITDIERGKPQEFHFCDEHARQHLSPADRGRREARDEQPGREAEPGRPGGGPGRAAAAEKQACPLCQITFQEFRNTGRLGCPYDYEVFRDELMPLLENIHEETRHTGKFPRRAPRDPAARPS